MRDVQLEVKQCRRCPIACGRQLCEKIVQNDWLVVRDRADFVSASKGIPFMDRAGLQIRKLFHSVGIAPRYTYLIKCEDTKFTVSHWNNCKTHLFHEIQETAPKKIVMLGKNTAARLKFTQKEFFPAKMEWGDHWGLALPYHGGKGLSAAQAEKAVSALNYLLSLDSI